VIATAAVTQAVPSARTFLSFSLTGSLRLHAPGKALMEHW